MGAYLEKPITEKHTEGDENGWIRYAATSMQGWRINQEDAHNCILDFDADCSLFAVYDGHGGSEVAQYTADNLPALLKSSETWKAKKYADAIEESFLEFDDHLRSEEVLADLKVMAGLHEKSQDHEHSDDEDKVALYEEAGMPLESILERYGFSLTKGRNGEPVLNIEEVNSARERRDKSPVDGEIEDTKSENANDVKSNRLLEGRNGKREDDTMKSSEKTDSGTVELAKKRFSGSPILKSPKRSKKSNGEHDRRSSQSESQSPGTDEKCVEKIDPCRSERSSRSESDANEVANESNGIVSVAMSSDDKDEPSILSAQPHPSISPENNVGLSSDSEQSVDEDYNEDEEMSEEDDSDQDEDAEMYGGPAGDTPGEDSGTTACVALVFKVSSSILPDD
ncbi:hypothetical protein AB6A40_009655 [Gnathostoma spinigerum]|uniref:protein-serine/threonine phosphatase n=1 Tax=Gnathostoma spinigerum TaxID=75299 RepID=A0ABD6EZI7_9BILA